MNVIGTSNLDAVDIDGTVQIDGATTFGVNGTGVDAKFFGGTSGRFMKWVTSTDVLHFTDNASIAIGSHATETTGDMLLYHNGTNSVIKNHSNVSTTELQLVTNAGPIRISGSSTQRSLIINQHITSSGNISSTGNLDVAGIISGSTALNLGYKPVGGSYISASSDGVLEISGSGNATLSVEGHITSSGNVKVAGDVEANGNIVGDNSTNITGINEVTVLDNINLAASKKITWVNDNSFLTGTDTSVTIDGDSIVNFYADQRFIFHDSNVGILTADQPQPHALTVTGEISSSGFISSQGAITGSNIKVGDDVVLTSAQARIQNTSAETSLLFGSADSAVVSIVSGSSTSVTVPFYFDTKNQRMGIKTALPTVPLQVEGTISGSTIDATTHKFSKTGTTDATHQGDVVYLGGTTSMDPGKIYHYKSDGTWELADADAASTSDGLLGVALGAASDTNGMLLRGMVTLDHDPGAVGDVLFLATGGTGQATATAPSGGSDIIRVIGYCLDASNGQIWFNPDNTFVEHS